MRTLNFDLDVLRGFVAGVEMGSFAQAADRLGRSTSALSAQLKKLEEQAGTPIVRKAGRGLALTPTGEILLSYARRLLALNDEAASAVRGAGLDGVVRLGMQEDFGEGLLTDVLGSFARAHPHVRIEARVARSVDLIAQVQRNELDLTLAWDTGQVPAYAEPVARLPMRWIGPAQGAVTDDDTPLPLVAFDAPCVMRTAAIAALDEAGRRWRAAFTSPSLAGVWAAVGAGLGLTVRTPVGLPAQLRVIDSGLPPLPEIDVFMLCGQAHPTPAVASLAQTVRQHVAEVAARAATVR
ncbi:MAG: LysR substrate-binding domain-containing protein [Rhodocyclaceae bacterium]